MARPPKYVVAVRYVVHTDEDGQTGAKRTVVVPVGSRLRATDPVVKANPDAFEPA